MKMKIIELEEKLQTNESKAKTCTRVKTSSSSSTSLATSTTTTTTKKKGNVNGNIFGLKAEKKRRLASIFMGGHKEKKCTVTFKHTQKIQLHSLSHRIYIIMYYKWKKMKTTSTRKNRPDFRYFCVIVKKCGFLP